MTQPQSRQEFIDRWKHEFGGMVFDAATSGRSGSELSVAMRLIQRKIDTHLARIYDDLVPNLLPPNGIPKPSVQPVQNVPARK